MEFVYPIPAWMRGKILDRKRLYAFPNIPEEKPFILDSGAFGLFKSGKRMNNAYFERLYKHYSLYEGWKVAPDVFLDPRVSMNNFRLWMKKYADCRICPVVQFAKKKKIDQVLTEYQIEFYLNSINELPIIFISNPGLIAEAWPHDFFLKLKNKYNLNWIHLLGAGWNMNDIRIYATLKGLDSIDSIVYYQDDFFNIKGTKTEIALNNQRKIDELLSNNF